MGIGPGQFGGMPPPRFGGGPQRFGRFTRVKLLGGEIIASIPLPGDPTAWFDADLNRTVSLRASLEGLKRRAHDLSGPFEAFRAIWFALTEQVFAAEGAVEGAMPWPALSPAYARRKEKAYPGMPILQRTQRLLKSLIGTGPGLVYEARPRSLVYGSRIPYFEFHMTGGESLDPRPPIILTRAAFGELNRLVVSHIAGRDYRRG